MKAIFERELRSYFNGITGYLFIAFLLLFAGIYTMAISLKGNYADFQYVLSDMSFTFLIIVPILTMRTIAEERRQKTDQLLYTLPIGMTKIVLAKFLAMLAVLFVPVAILSIYPLILTFYGTIHLTTAYCAIIGFYFLGAALIAIGMFVSSLTENQAIAAVLCFLVLLLNYFLKNLTYYLSSSASASFIFLTLVVIAAAIVIGILTKNGFFAFFFGLLCEIVLFIVMMISSAALAGLFPAIMEKLAVFSQFDNFVNGIFDLTGLVYFLMVILVMIFLTVQSLEKKEVELMAKKNISAKLRGLRPDKAHFKSLFTSRSFRVGSYSIFASLIVIAIAVGVIMMADALPSKYTKLDLTANQLYSFSDQTKQLVSGLKNEVDIYFLAQSGSEDQTIQEMLNRYQALSKQIKVIKKDPVVYPDFAKQYTDSQISDNSILVVCGDRSRYIGYDEIFVTNYTSYTDSTTDFAGESALTSAIDYVTSDNLPKVYLLTGHGEPALGSSVVGAIAKENIETADLSLLKQDTVPADAACLLINAPASDLSAAEKDKILTYLKAGGHLLLLTDFSPTAMPNLAAVMEYYGVKAVNGLVVEGDSNYCVSGYRQYLLPQIGDHEITQPLKQGNYYVLMPLAQGIEKLTGARDSVSITDLLTTSASAYSKPAGYKMTTTDKEAGDIDGPFTLGVAITERTADGKQTQIVWYTTSQMLNDTINQLVSGGNQDLFLNSLDWMTARENSISIHAKSMDTEKLTISAAASALWSLVMIVVLPLGFLIVGICVFVRRKHK